MSRLSRVFLIMALVMAVLGGAAALLRGIYSSGFDAGALHERDSAKQAADDRRREDQRLARQLAATARAEADDWRNRAHRLQQEVSHARTRLYVAAPGGGVAGDGLRLGCGPAAGDATSAQAPDGAGQQQLQDELPGGAWLRLSHHGVRVWNSALAGADVPAGACGADGSPAGACAAATDTTVEDAFGNHIENAVRCGIDRARHRRLIEFLKARSGVAPAQQ